MPQQFILYVWRHMGQFKQKSDEQQGIGHS
jgi:hypothetical protein